MSANVQFIILLILHCIIIAAQNGIYFTGDNHVDNEQSDEFPAERSKHVEIQQKHYASKAIRVGG